MYIYMCFYIPTFICILLYMCFYIHIFAYILTYIYVYVAAFEIAKMINAGVPGMSWDLLFQPSLFYNRYK